jgi:hypothetical protein
MRRTGLFIIDKRMPSLYRQAHYSLRVASIYFIWRLNCFMYFHEHGAERKKIRQGHHVLSFRFARRHENTIIAHSYHFLYFRSVGAKRKHDYMTNWPLCRIIVFSPFALQGARPRVQEDLRIRIKIRIKS